MRTRQSADSSTTSSINLGDAIKSFYHKTGLYYDATHLSLAHTAAYVCFYVGVALMMCGAEANSLCSPPRNQPIKASGGGPTATLHQFL
jgi:hypothetical protein